MFHFWFTLAMGDDFAPFLASGLGLSLAFFRGQAFLGEKVCADVQIVAVYDHEEGVQAFPLVQRRPIKGVFLQKLHETIPSTEKKG